MIEPTTIALDLALTATLGVLCEADNDTAQQLSNALRTIAHEVPEQIKGDMGHAVRSRLLAYAASVNPGIKEPTTNTVTSIERPEGRLRGNGDGHAALPLS